MKIGMSRRIMAAFALSVGLMVAMAGLTYLRTRDLAAADKAATHSNEILAELEGAVWGITEAESGVRGFLLTENDTYLRWSSNGAQEVPQYLQRLYQLTASAPSQQARVAELDQASQKILAWVRQIVDIYQSQGLPAAKAAGMTGKGRAQMDGVRQIASQVRQDQKRALQASTEVLERKTRRFTLCLRVLAAIMLLVLGAAFYQVRNEIHAHARVQNELSQSQEELQEALHREQKLSRRDPLTQVANRRGFFEALEIECRRARRNGWPVSVAYIDVDGFKSFNDSLGHAAGDALLVTVAGTMQRNVRAGCCVARFGGDEFALMIPDVKLAEIEITLRRIRSLLLKEMQGNGWPVTFSIGAVVFSEPVESGEEMIHLADQEMYVVKNRSKDDISVIAAGARTDKRPSLA